MSRFGLLSLVLAILAGCPTPVPQPPITIVDADGASQVVSIDTACATAAKLCGLSTATCAADLAALAGNAPEDLVCASVATTKAGIQACAGFGRMCP